MIYETSDDDDDCAAGLMCLQRSDDDDPVSAYCEGIPDDDSDYCVPNPVVSSARADLNVTVLGVLTYAGNDGEPENAFPLQVCQADW